MERETLEQCGRCRRIVTEGWMLPPWYDIPSVETWADCRLPTAVRWVRLSDSTDPMPIIE